jgi:hypothetical protein
MLAAPAMALNVATEPRIAWFIRVSLAAENMAVPMARTSSDRRPGGRRSMFNADRAGGPRSSVRTDDERAKPARKHTVP